MVGIIVSEIIISYIITNEDKLEKMKFTTINHFSYK